MYSDIPDIKTDFTSIPNDLHLVCKTTNEMAVLIVLLRLQGKNNSCYVSQRKLSVMVCLKNKTSITTATKSLISKGYIEYKQGNAVQNLANEYCVHLDKILCDIRHKLDASELMKREKRERSPREKKAIMKSMINKDTETAREHLADAFGDEIKTKSGEIFKPFGPVIKETQEV